jgi:hypothetical protein
VATFTYSEAKSIIQDGDIIFVHGSPYEFVQALIMFCTGSPFSHCCIAFHVKIEGIDKIMCVEAQGHTKRRIIPLSLYREYSLTVIAAPKPWSKVSDKALNGVGTAKYDMLRAIYIGISEFSKRVFNVNCPAIDRMDEICSIYCGEVYDIVVNGSPQVLYDKLMVITYER